MRKDITKSNTFFYLHVELNVSDVTHIFVVGYSRRFIFSQIQSKKSQNATPWVVAGWQGNNRSAVSMNFINSNSLKLIGLHDMFCFLIAIPYLNWLLFFFHVFISQYPIPINVECGNGNSLDLTLKNRSIYLHYKVWYKTNDNILK